MKKTAAIRNRRVSNTRQRKQQHLLEVTVRRDIARKQQTRRFVGITCRIVLTVGLIGGAFCAGKEALRRFLWENPDYFLSEVHFHTDGALPREQVLAAAKIVEGRNIFELDLGKARAAIDALPQVDRVEIQRVLPNGLKIDIIERKPIAWATARADEDPSVSDKAFLIDARGVVMRSKTMPPDYLLLPIISGVPVENYVPGQVVKSFEMQAALDLVRLNSDSARFQIRNIDLSKGYCLVVTDRNRVRVTFGLDGVDQQQARLNRILERIHRSQREVQTVNLLVERNIPVTFAEPVPAPPEPTAAVPAPVVENAKEKFLSTKDPSPQGVRPQTILPKETRSAAPAAPSGARRSSPRTSGRKAGKPVTVTKKPFKP